MKINALTQLREVIGGLLIRRANLHKPFRNFIIETMILYIVMLGKVNYTSMARISDSCESRFRQNFRQSFDWLGFNAQFTERMDGQRAAIAIDPSYISKAGKKTPGVGYFWSGCAGAPKWGLEILGIALVNADTNEAVHLKAVQTIKRPKKRGPKPQYLKALKESNGLFAIYLDALHKDAERLCSICKHVVADYLDTDKKTQTRKVYFASDRSLLGKDIFDLYRTRFQIEFLYCRSLPST